MTKPCDMNFAHSRQSIPAAVSVNLIDVSRLCMKTFKIWPKSLDALFFVCFSPFRASGSVISKLY